MSIAQSHSVTIKMLKTMLAKLSPEITLDITGNHAVGKSEIVYQGAAERRSDFYKDADNCKKMVSDTKLCLPRKRVPETTWDYDRGMPVIERRLSQLTEGDMVGVPMITENGTEFRPVNWIMMACKYPVVLFLDERNRALENVKQAVFQLCDSRAFYGHKLHPETVIVIAENTGPQYTVVDRDPAEISRCAMVTLEPDVDEWLEYARSINVHENVIDFISQEKSCLEHKGAFEGGKKYADRRSWVKLDAELRGLGLSDSPEDGLFYALSGAMLGTEVALKYKNFCINNDKRFSVEDILTDWPKVRTKLARRTGEVPRERYVEAVDKLRHFAKDNELTDPQVKQVAAFLWDAPREFRLAVWGALHQKSENVIKVHGVAQDLIVATATGAPDPAPPANIPAAVNAKPAPAASTPAATPAAPAKRGPGRPKK